MRADLARSRVSIHLIGKNYSFVPEGGSTSLIEIQNELAIERGAEGDFLRLLWIPAGLQISDPRQQGTIERIRTDPRIDEASDVLETELTDFRTHLQERIERMGTPAPPPPLTPPAPSIPEAAPAAPVSSPTASAPAASARTASAPLSAPTPAGPAPAASGTTQSAAPDAHGAVRSVYLIYDQRDADAVNVWSDALFGQRIEVLHPLFDGDETEIREYHDDTLRTCDGVMIVFGAANEAWLRRKMRESRRAPATAARSRRRRSRSASSSHVPLRRIVSVPTTASCCADGRATRPTHSGPTSRGCVGRMAHKGFNPFPGLRPFEADEDHLFFGREREIDDLLRRLRTTRFLAVVGTSGSGKSSLIRSGLIPSLFSGFMAKAGTSWRVATLRPGEDPFGHLATALSPPDILGSAEPELAGTQAVLIDATLRRSPRGLVEAVRLAHLPPGDNLLVVVDQFEELFRFRRSRQIEHSRDEAIGFVRLLLEAAKQNDAPIYVVLTMRSDFIGDCMEYPGLAEAVNDGQYLVPRMGRDALRSAISGPVAVAGGKIAPRLVQRLLNEIGDNHDQLPVLQHALMRSWDHWAAQEGDQPLDVANYEAIGTMQHALSLHAEEAYAEAGTARQDLVGRLFKALTDTFADPRGIRRPTSVGELCAISGGSDADVRAVVDLFRHPGRSFLMPPLQVELTPRSIIDVSHESLMRCWERLIAWADEERTAAAFYVRLVQASAWHGQGTAALWRDPELELALRWKRETRPTAAWGRRIVDGDEAAFERAMVFVDRSEAERTRERAERAHQRRRKLQQAWWAAGVLGVMLIGASVLAYVAWRERERATMNFGLARAAVDQTLSSVDVDPIRAGADVPQMAKLRRELLERAKKFSQEFLQQDPRGADLRKETALAHLRLGHISRMLASPVEAEAEYRKAIEQLTRLEKEQPAAEYRKSHRRRLRLDRRDASGRARPGSRCGRGVRARAAAAVGPGRSRRHQRGLSPGARADVWQPRHSPGLRGRRDGRTACSSGSRFPRSDPTAGSARRSPDGDRVSGAVPHRQQSRRADCRGRQASA